MNNRIKLGLLADKVFECSKCPELVSSRRQHVFGEGNSEAGLVLLGEAPGRTEDETGRPFVGRSGQLLDVMMGNVGLRREDVYILNVVKCHPEHNRNPLPEEVSNCRPFLDLQLRVIRPKVVLCLGGVAAKALLGTTASVNSLRGTWYDYGSAKVLVTFHPAYLLRNPADKAKAWSDFAAVKSELESK